MERRTIKIAIALCLITGAFITSCKRNDSIPTPVNNFDIPNASCVLTKSSEDLFGNPPYVIVYDAKGKITNFGAGTVTYDSLNRLKKLETPMISYTFNYQGSTFLPFERIYKNKTNNTDTGNCKYYYNTKGQLTTIVLYVKTSFGVTAYTDSIFYNNNGNTTSITRTKDGSTETIYQGLAYDNFGNPHKTNQWLIKLYGEDDAPFDCLYYSTNNATSYKLNWDGTLYNCTVAYTYNAKNFPLTVTTTAVCPADTTQNFIRTETLEYLCK